ncbi:hypothetical protein ACTA71_005986 [Dictyostelium dimigraforme]
MIQIIKKPKELKSLDGKNFTMEVISICWSDLKDSGHQNFVVLTENGFNIDSLLQDDIIPGMSLQSKLKARHKNEAKLCMEIMNFMANFYNDYDDDYDNYDDKEEEENIDYHLVRYERLNNEGKEDLLIIFKSDDVIYIKTEEEEERKKNNVFLFNDTKVTPVKTKLKAYQKPIEPSETLVNATIQQKMSMKHRDPKEGYTDMQVIGAIFLGVGLGWGLPKLWDWFLSLKSTATPSVIKEVLLDTATETVPELISSSI